MDPFEVIGHSRNGGKPAPDIKQLSPGIQERRLKLAHAIVQPLYLLFLFHSSLRGWVRMGHLPPLGSTSSADGA
ncbi:hypothetical protein ACLQ25_00505 [Micromonospora sp. DT44]|uniref:hypothetical protein n=1 Tax=Micromonospora sp. DT44 TaxID=3393439 RepID=UPI003CF92A5F